MSRLSDIQSRWTDLFKWTGDKLAPVDFALASYASTYLAAREQRPWGFLQGGGGSGKTEILKTLGDSDPSKEQPKRTVWQGDMTENAFASGYRSEEEPDKDPSMLAKLDYRRNPEGNKVLVCTEMGPVLGLPRERRGRFFNQMRMAYDGEYDQNAGNIGHVWYKLGFGFVGAATQVLDDVMKTEQLFGQRALICRMSRRILGLDEDYREIRAGADIDPYHKKAHLAETKRLVTAHMDAFVKDVAGQEFYIKHPTIYLDELVALATLATRIRIMPVSSHTITTDPERAHRLRDQLITLLDGRAAFDERDCWDETDMALLRRVIHDTLPPEFLAALRVMWDRGPEDAKKPKSLEQVRFRAHGDDGLRRQFTQWTILGVVMEHAAGSYSWTQDAINYAVKSKFFDGLDMVPDVR